MSITLRFFGEYRERAGTDEAELESICEACGVDLDAFVTEYRKRL